MHLDPDESLDKAVVICSCESLQIRMAYVDGASVKNKVSMYLSVLIFVGICQSYPGITLVSASALVQWKGRRPEMCAV